ncbi:MAG: apolipoprotein A1/A4/E family protein [Akkermansiaceae bacterium]|nr:apolipoprotein A1/A4/E family protein [Akkermansiaceae bacterium]
MHAISNHKGRLAQTARGVGSGLLAGLLLWMGGASPAWAGSMAITSVTPRTTQYVLDGDQGSGRDYHLLKGTVTVLFTGQSSEVTTRLRLKVLDENDDELQLVAGTDLTATWIAPELREVRDTAENTFSFALDPDDKLETDRVYRVRAQLEKRVLIGGTTPQWITVPAVPALDSTPRHYFHFTNTAGSDPAVNTLALVESLAFTRDWRVQTGTTDQQDFIVTADTRFLRYDEFAVSPAEEDELSFQFRLTLKDDLGQAQTLAFPPNGSKWWTENMMTWQPGILPTDIIRTLEFRFRPQTQLDPVNRTYQFTLEAWVTPSPRAQMVRLSQKTLPFTRLLDFNGTLRFGSIFTTTMLDAARTTTLYAPKPGAAPPYVAAELNLNQVSVSGGGATYAGSLGTRTLRLLATGLATYNDAATLSLPNAAGAVQARLSHQGIPYKLGSSLALSASGATAPLYLDPLPAGMGVTEDNTPPTGTTTTSGLFSRLPVQAGVALGSTLLPANAVTWSFPAGVWVMEETKPVAVRATAITWQTSNGILSLTTPGEVHHPETAMRAKLAAAPAAVPYRERRSNSDYWLLVNGIDVSPEPTLRGRTTPSPEPGSNAVATMDFSVAPGTFKSHFPEATITVNAATGNRIYVADDMISASSSFLDDVDISLAYLAGDPTIDPTQNSYADDTRTVTLEPANASKRLNFTATGGLRGACGVASGVALKWGKIDATQYAFATDAFQSATFYMPGTFYPMPPLLDGVSDLFHQQCPVNIHLVGHLNSKWKFSDLETPGSDSYNGNTLRADYAGINLRVANEATGFQGHSIISGVPAGSYPLKPLSRFYARKAGVTGIHDAIGGPTEVSLYGFNATLENYGFAFRDCRLVHSVTDGALTVPSPSNFSMPLANLRFSASGRPLGADLPAALAPVTLEYWQTEVVPSGLAFQSTDPTNTAAGVLTMQAAVRLASLGLTVNGTLGFHNTGRLITPADGIEGVTSRLRAPNQITFNGPVKPSEEGEPPAYETYHLTPLTEVYLNSYDGTGSAGDGFLNLAGKLDVAFFEDLQVHLQASANSTTAAEVAVLHLTGGWTAAGKNFFNDPTGFDAGNRGYPDGVSLVTYRSGAAYRPIARREWLNSINFEYPLVWDNTTRMFGTAEDFDGDVDLLVLNAKHRLESLGAEQAALNFGVRYDGVPQIDLGNLLVNAVDEATGALSSLEEALGSAVGAVLWASADASAGLLNDSFDAWFGPVLEQNMGAGINVMVLEPLVDDDPALPAGTLMREAFWNDNLLALTGGPGGWLQQELTKLGNGPDGPKVLTDRITEGIDKIIEGLDVFIDPSDGLLATYPNGDYKFGAELVYSLIDQLASDDLQRKLGVKRGGDMEAGIGQQTTRLVNQYAPGLNAAKQRLEQLKARLEELKTRLDAPGDLAKVIQERFSNNSAEWQTLGTLLAADLKTHLRQRYGNNRQAFALPENRDATAAFLIRRIRDRVGAAAIATGLQTMMRQQLQDLQGAIDQTVDSMFSNFKHIIRDLVKEVAGNLDEAVAAFTGDLGSTVGAGSVEGHAVIRGDSLEHLRLDAKLSLTLDEPIEFNGFLEINRLQADGPYGDAREIILGTEDAPIEIMGSTANFNINGRIVLAANGTPLGLGGSIVMTSGSLKFESFKITDLGASLMFGVSDNYLAAKLGMEFESFRIMGGLFVGHSNSLEPLRMVDPDVADVIKGPSITGIYAYGELFMPIVDWSCMFRVSAGLGIGAFYFTEGPTYGGKIYVAASGEALCVLKVAGEVVLVGAKSDIIRFKGRGKIKGSIDFGLFEIGFKKQVTFTYDENNGFDADY